MVDVEGNTLGVVLIIETIVWGLLMAAGGVIYVWLASKDERPRASDDRAAVCAKKVRVTRRQMMLYAAIAFAAMFLAALFTLFKIGTHVRPDDAISVNWTYLTLTAAAWVSLALLHGLYFWFPWFGQTAALAAIWGGIFLLLATAPLSTSNDKRDVLFGLAVGLQGLSLIYIIWFSGRWGPMWRWRGWATAAPVIVAFLLFDIFWYIGYLNAQRGATALGAPWETHLPFFIANLCALVVSAAVAAWTYKAKKSDIDTIMEEVKSDDAHDAPSSAMVENGSGGALLPAFMAQFAAPPGADNQSGDSMF